MKKKSRLLEKTNSTFDIRHSRTPQLDIARCIKNSGGDQYRMIQNVIKRSRDIVYENWDMDNAEQVRAPITALLEVQNQTNPEVAEVFRYDLMVRSLA